MDGTLSATDREFTVGSRRVSAHYGIEGTVVHQYVHDADTAWHAGNWVENTKSIGIEHSAQPGRDATPATIATSVALMATLCRQYGIDPSHIYPHKKFYATQCPGTLPIAAMIAAVRAQLAAPVTPTPFASPVRGPFPLPVGAGYGIGGHLGAGLEQYAVKEIQTLLRSIAPGIAIDGNYGPTTRAWVGYWTKRFGPYPTGVVNKQVWDFMAAFKG
jgi:hypothetical protein